MPQKMRATSVSARPGAVIPNLDASSFKLLAGELKEIKSKLEKKPDGVGKQVGDCLKASVKSVEMAGKLASLVKTGNRMNVVILSNIEGLVLELATQSCEGFDKCSGAFVFGPDPLIMPGIAATIVSAKRDNSAAGNINGVIYKAFLSNAKEKAYKITIAWDSPLAGNAHYHLEVEPWSETVDKGFLKKAVNSNQTGVIRYPDSEHPLPGCPFETVSVFSSEEISVLIQPLA